MDGEILFAMALTEFLKLSRKDRQEALNSLQACARALSDTINVIAPEEHDNIIHLIYQTCLNGNTKAERKQYEDMLKYCIYGAEYDD